MQKSFNPRFIDRKGTNSLKFDGMEPLFGRGNLEPFWVADMDFETPVFIKNAIIKKANESVYGYPVVDELFFEAIIEWFQKRFGDSIKREWIVPTVGVASSMYAAISVFAKNGGVVIQPPVYGPFFSIAKIAGGELIEAPLLFDGGSYEIDFEKLEWIFKTKKPAVFLLCSPHNPIGKVWSEDELFELTLLCDRYSVMIISDEIHFDLVYDGKTHKTITSVKKDGVILLSAPTKSFNIAGINVSYAVVPSKKDRAIFEVFAKNMHLTLPNIFGIEALKAAYFEGESYLDELLVALAKNRSLAHKTLSEIPSVFSVLPDATYLYWMDFCATGIEPKKLKELFAAEGIALSGGDFFFGGKESSCFRLNFGTSKERVEMACEAIRRAICRG